jgi:hypothetical protein
MCAFLFITKEAYTHIPCFIMHIKKKSFITFFEYTNNMMGCKVALPGPWSTQIFFMMVDQGPAAHGGFACFAWRIRRRSAARLGW